MPSAWVCTGCRTTNHATAMACEICGTSRPDAPLAAQAEPRHCPIDGAILSPVGYCDRADGYPIQLPCPWVCPFCRRALTWEGACFACLGTRTRSDRASWTKPGDRYEILAGHWKLVEKGPFAVLDPEANRAALQQVYAALATTKKLAV